MNNTINPEPDNPVMICANKTKLSVEMLTFHALEFQATANSETLRADKSEERIKELTAALAVSQAHVKEVELLNITEQKRATDAEQFARASLAEQRARDKDDLLAKYQLELATEKIRVENAGIKALDRSRLMAQCQESLKEAERQLRLERDLNRNIRDRLGLSEAESVFVAIERLKKQIPVEDVKPLLNAILAIGLKSPPVDKACNCPMCRSVSARTEFLHKHPEVQ